MQLIPYRYQTASLQRKESLKNGLLLVLALLMLPLADALANTPTIRLFPTTVVEDLQQTSTVAREMESGLQEVIGRLDQQQLLYLESKCEGADNDPGCQRLSKQLGATYLEMLGIMEERLPDMEHTVNNTRLSLEKRLRSELGNKMTPWMLQDTLLGSETAASSSDPVHTEVVNLLVVWAVRIHSRILSS